MYHSESTPFEVPRPVIEIRIGGLDDPQVIELLELHMSEVRAKPTPGGAHVLDRTGLKAPA